MKSRVISAVLMCIALVAAAGLTGCDTGPTFATGYSSDPNPQVAGRKAAQLALANLGDAPCKGIIFTVYFERQGFEPKSAAEYLPDPEAEEAAAYGVSQIAKEAPNIGFRAQALTLGGSQWTSGVAALAIGGKDINCAAAATPILDNRRETGNRLAYSLNNVRDLKCIIALSEMRLSFENAPNINATNFIRGVTENLNTPNVTLLGANAMNLPDSPADKGLAGATFYYGRLLEGHVAAMGIGGALSVYTDQRDEFRPIGKPAVVTAVQGPWLVNLNCKPAADIYRKLAGMKPDELFTSDWTNPLAIRLKGSNKHYLRMIVDEIGKDGKNREGKPSALPVGSLRLSGPLPLGAEVQIMVGGNSDKAILLSARESVEAAIAEAQAANARPGLALVTNCCTRAMRLRAMTGNKKDAVFNAIRPGVKNMGLLPAPTADTANPQNPHCAIFGFYAFGHLGPLGGEFQNLNCAFQQHNVLTTVLASP